MQEWLLAAALLVAGAGEPARVADLAWLSGHWAQADGERWAEESWSDAKGGVLLGIGKNGRGERLGGFEYMRIAADADGAVTFWGSPGGAPAVAFSLVSSGPDHAVFENPAHDFPQRVSYRREGDALVATVSDIRGGSAQRWRFERTK